MDFQYSLCPFKILLNKLSSNIDDMHLQSLIHVCGDLIAPVERQKISYAFQVFTILEQKNAIGKEPKQMAFLLEILRKVRPKKEALANMVKRYIEGNYEEPERQEILGCDDDLESSSGDCPVDIPQPSTSKHDTVCFMDCGCCDCICHGECCCCCCIIVAIFIGFLVVLVVVFWYTRTFPVIKDSLHSHENSKYLGPLLIIVLLAFGACCIGCGIYIRVKKRKKLEHSLSLRSFNVPSYQAIDQSYKPDKPYALVSTRASSSRAIDRPRSRAYSYSPSVITSDSQAEQQEQEEQGNEAYEALQEIDLESSA